jgi:hypothetical protein
MTRILYPLVQPQSAGLIRRSAQAGYLHGQMAELLLTMDLENSLNGLWRSYGIVMVFK